jgi:4-hydroxy-2-oxoheptanedioate aldolase
MRKNRLRERLDAGQPTLGTRLHATWPAVVEAIGYTAAFDYVEFLAEYAPFDLHDLDNFCRTAELHKLATMIKVDAESRAYVAQRAIGAGFQAVLFADCRTARDARECVRCVRPDTPGDGGAYGAAMRRMAYMTYGGGPDYVQALREIVVVLMIEKQAAVENLEEILSVDGIDMVQWGGVDYSMSIGRPGAKLAPEVKAVERRVIEAALSRGVPPRAEIGSVEQARYYLDLGVQHFSLGVDLSILYGWFAQNGQDLRDLIGAA